MYPLRWVRLAQAVAAIALSSGSLSAAANVTVDGPPGLAGLVRSDRSPLSAARVYAYQVSNLSLTKATTSGDGKFARRRALGGQLNMRLMNPTSPLPVSSVRG